MSKKSKKESKRVSFVELENGYKIKNETYQNGTMKLSLYDVNSNKVIGLKCTASGLNENMDYLRKIAANNEEINNEEILVYETNLSDNKTTNKEEIKETEKFEDIIDEMKETLENVKEIMDKLEEETNDEIPMDEEQTSDQITMDEYEATICDKEETSDEVPMDEEDEIKESIITKVKNVIKTVVNKVVEPIKSLWKTAKKIFKR